MRRRVAVVMGGISDERDVSLRSGKAVAEGLRSNGHDVVEVDLHEASIAPILTAKPAGAFIMLHGRFGEDGSIQAMLEEADVPFTGSDSLASRAGMNKMASKCFLLTHDVPTPPFQLVSTRERWDEIEEAMQKVGLPLVTKPLRQGSSIGISIARDQEQVAVGLAKAFKYGHEAVLERYIEGREFTVGVLGDKALPVIEIKTRRGFFNKEAKYSDKTTEYISHPDLALRAYEKLQALALAAHEAIGCRHLSRVDMMIENDGSPYVLEVNTIPGFTERSLYPMAAREAGLGFGELCDHILEMTLAPSAAEHVTA